MFVGSVPFVFGLASALRSVPFQDRVVRSHSAWNLLALTFAAASFSVHSALSIFFFISTNLSGTARSSPSGVDVPDRGVEGPGDDAGARVAPRMPSTADAMSPTIADASSSSSALTRSVVFPVLIVLNVSSSYQICESCGGRSVLSAGKFGWRWTFNFFIFQHFIHQELPF